MDRMLKNLRKKTHSQLWIVVAFVALFVLADQGAYADMMDSGGQEPSLTISYEPASYSDTGSYDSHSYDSAPAASFEVYQTNPDDWSQVGGEWSYTAPVDSNLYTGQGPSDYVSPVSDFTPSFDCTPSYQDYINSGNYTYGPVSEAGYNNAVSTTTPSSYIMDGGNYVVFEPGVLQPQETLPMIEPIPDGLGERGAVVISAGPFLTVTETKVQDVSGFDPYGVQGPSFNPAAADTYDTSASHVVQDTSLSNDPSHYLGTYGRNFTPDDFQADPIASTQGDGYLHAHAQQPVISPVEKKGGILEFIGGVAGGIVEHTIGVPIDIGKGVYKAGADHVYGPLIGTGNGDEFKPGVLTNAVGETAGLASGAVDWGYNDLARPIGEHTVGFIKDTTFGTAGVIGEATDTHIIEPIFK